MAPRGLPWSLPLGPRGEGPLASRVTRSLWMDASFGSAPNSFETRRSHVPTKSRNAERDLAREVAFDHRENGARRSHRPWMSVRLRPGSPRRQRLRYAPQPHRAPGGRVLLPLRRRNACQTCVCTRRRVPAHALDPARSTRNPVSFAGRYGRPATGVGQNGCYYLNSAQAACLDPSLAMPGHRPASC